MGDQIRYTKQINHKDKQEYKWIFTWVNKHGGSSLNTNSNVVCKPLTFYCLIHVKTETIQAIHNFHCHLNLDKDSPHNEQS